MASPGLDGSSGDADGTVFDGGSAGTRSPHTGSVVAALGPDVTTVDEDVTACRRAIVSLILRNGIAYLVSRFGKLSRAAISPSAGTHPSTMGVGRRVIIAAVERNERMGASTAGASADTRATGTTILVTATIGGHVSAVEGHSAPCFERNATDARGVPSTLDGKGARIGAVERGGSRTFRNLPARG